MKVVVFQLLAVASLAVLAIFLWISMEFTRDGTNSDGELIWDLRVERIAAPKKKFWKVWTEEGRQSNVSLPEGCYYCGNRRISDDIYVDSSGGTVRMYLNVQKEKLYLSVLKGNIYIDNQLYCADPSKRIEIQEYARIRISDDIEVRFNKRRKNRWS